TDAGVADEKTFADFVGFLVGVLHMNAHQITEVLWTRLVAHFPRGLGVDGHEIQRNLWIGLQINVGIMVMRAPDNGLGTAHTGYPDRRVRLLQWALERIHDPELVMFAFPTKRSRSGPGFDDEIVCLLEPLTVMGG